MTQVNIGTETMREGLRDVVARVSGLQRELVHYAHENRAFGTTSIRLTMGPVLGSSEADNIARQATASGTLAESTYGDRSVRVQLAYECRPADGQQDEATAHLLVISARLNLAPIREQLSAAGLAVRSVGSVVSQSAVRVDRAVSRAVVDVTFNATHVEPINEAFTVDVFETFGVSGSADDAGTTVQIPARTIP